MTVQSEKKLEKYIKAFCGKKKDFILTDFPPRLLHIEFHCIGSHSKEKHYTRCQNSILFIGRINLGHQQQLLWLQDYSNCWECKHFQKSTEDSFKTYTASFQLGIEKVTVGRRGEDFLHI